MDRIRNVTVAGRLAFQNDGHIRELFEALNEQRESARFCDAILKVGHRKIKGHRCVFAAAIPKLLENQDGEEESVLKVDLEDLDPDAVEVLVEFAYTATLNVSAEDVLNVYHAAKRLGVTEVLDSCEQFIREKILPLDWMAVRGFAEQQDCPNLMTAVDKYIEQHVEEIYHKKDFFQLPRLQIELATTNDRQNESVDSEKLCNVALTWAQKQLEVRLSLNIFRACKTHFSFTCLHPCVCLCMCTAFHDPCQAVHNYRIQFLSRRNDFHCYSVDY